MSMRKDTLGRMNNNPRNSTFMKWYDDDQDNNFQKRGEYRRAQVRYSANQNKLSIGWILCHQKCPLSSCNGVLKKQGRRRVQCSVHVCNAKSYSASTSSFSTPKKPSATAGTHPVTTTKVRIPASDGIQETKTEYISSTLATLQSSQYAKEFVDPETKKNQWYIGLAKKTVFVEIIDSAIREEQVLVVYSADGEEETMTVKEYQNGVRLYQTYLDNEKRRRSNESSKNRHAISSSSSSSSSSHCFRLASAVVLL